MPGARTTRRAAAVGFILTIATWVSATIPAVAGSGSATATQQSVSHDGLERDYLLYVPAALPPGPRPLVLALHGGLGSDEKASDDSSPQSHWKHIADRDGLIVAYPNGIDSNWNDCRSDDGTTTSSADDVGFLSAVIDAIDAGHDVDLTRVYATGGSNGGMMAYRLAFELTHRIAAVGAGIANLPVDPASECRPPDRPITVAIMNGDADPLMPWDGGCIGRVLCGRGTVRSAEATRDYWTAHNAASATPTATHAYPDVHRRDLSTVTRFDHTGGTGGHEVAFFHVAGGGHRMPSTHHGGVLSPGGNGDIEATEELWAVMRRHAR